MNVEFSGNKLTFDFKQDLDKVNQLMVCSNHCRQFEFSLLRHLIAQELKFEMIDSDCSKVFEIE